ncbi:class I SAM-dependent rRNA methyltransferase [Trichococcus ilyis]|jgi:23S rRNA (cytosine1962-C5)-methyltransferase|uniref:23S rRNA (Cytosine1962-C5)-methyltransferase n=1 Tax=Trichococcus ilyis TaxID=640938 RepID=A0A143YB69_9LACT|nr:class I SAM-dependent rRNA methyltransferase [Trichococcus ilyis]CZQ84431.1 s-adenosylmethionine-dependent methyltransferase [Trichococcus ilyis]SEJ60449.1 23S rRNA (cytosine1962-C5)-methyltransferase [Trichococcus ilyis]
MKKKTITQLSAKKIKAGNPLLQPEDFPNELSFEEGEIVELVDSRQAFVAKAYLAKQNKGVGWVFSLNNADNFNAAFFRQQFEKAKHARSNLQADPETTAYRLFNAEGDGIPGVTIDHYAGFAVFSWYSEGIFRYQTAITAAFQAIFPEVKGIYEKFRYQRNDGLISRFVSGEAAPAPLIVKENGINYATYLDDGLMTGIFLDQRDVRGALTERYAAGKRVLNTFSYTGAFSVAAAMGGAIETTSVDVANRSLERTKEQFAVNDLDNENQKIYVMDVFDFIRYAIRKELQYDVTIIDPPSFARTKKRTFSVTKDYTQLLEELIQITAPGGTLIVSSNAANYKEKNFKQDIAQAFKNSRCDYRILETFHLPSDFAVPAGSNTSDYLKVFIIRKLAK